MKCRSGDEIPASKAVEHIQFRLCAEQAPSIDLQIKAFKDIDKMIEHMRIRLKSTCKLMYRDDYRQSSSLPEVQHHYAPSAGPY